MQPATLGAAFDAAATSGNLGDVEDDEDDGVAEVVPNLIEQLNRGEGPPGSSWVSWGPPGSSWVLLAAPGSSWVLLPIPVGLLRIY